MKSKLLLLALVLSFLCTPASAMMQPKGGGSERTGQGLAITLALVIGGVLHQAIVAPAPRGFIDVHLDRNARPWHHMPVVAQQEEPVGEPTTLMKWEVAEGLTLICVVYPQKNLLVIFDPKTGAVLKSIQFGGEIQGLIAHGNELCVVAGDGVYIIYNPAKNDLIYSTQVGSGASAPYIEDGHFVVTSSAGIFKFKFLEKTRRTQDQA
jgi:hypothetical protein